MEDTLPGKEQHFIIKLAVALIITMSRNVCSTHLQNIHICTCTMASNTNCYTMYSFRTAICYGIGASKDQKLKLLALGLKW